MDELFGTYKECGCYKTFHEYSSFMGGHYLYYTSDYHKKECLKREKVQNEEILKLKEKRNNLQTDCLNLPYLKKPLKYLGEYKSAQRFLQCFSTQTKESLSIVKIKNRYYCCGNRVDLFKDKYKKDIEQVINNIRSLGSWTHGDDQF